MECACMLFTFENGVPLMRKGASVVWHHSLLLMNSFSCRLCFLRAFPFISSDNIFIIISYSPLTLHIKLNPAQSISVPSLFWAISLKQNVSFVMDHFNDLTKYLRLFGQEWPLMYWAHTLDWPVMTTLVFYQAHKFNWPLMYWSDTLFQLTSYRHSVNMAATLNITLWKC